MKQLGNLPWVLLCPKTFEVLKPHPSILSETLQEYLDPKGMNGYITKQRVECGR